MKAFVCSLLALLAVVATAQDLGSTATIRIGVLRNGSYDIVTLPLETYIARVLTGEALPGSEPAALESLAIAIRTYATGNRGKHRAEGFDLCDQTHCQVMRPATAVTERAAQATTGQVLLFKGQPATVYYSASCGGRTEKPSNVWPGADDPPYLPSHADDGCDGQPEWSTELDLADLQRALRAAGFTGSLRNVKIAERNESGRAATLALDGMTPSGISGQDLRAAIGRTLGWQYLQSAAFQLKRSGDRFKFTGHGYGHGVGMCVIGSVRLAEQGESARQILKRYFPGTEIGLLRPVAVPSPPSVSGSAPRPRPAAPSSPSVTIPPAAAPAVTTVSSDVVIALSEGDEGARDVISTLVRRERDALARALGVSAPTRVTARFHPTTDAFEAAAGTPWFTLGSASGNEMQFAPLLVLRDRGVLDRTVRHQLVHVLADGVLSGRPAWVREGAAMHFADAPKGALPARVTCPDDEELTRPVSVGAFTDASSRARACFERALALAKDWREVR